MGHFDHTGEITLDTLAWIE